VFSYVEVAKKRSKGRQEHPTGPLETVDDDWKARVRAAMAEMDPPWDQKDLADKVGVSKAAITNLFKPGPRQIRFKAKVHKELGWPDSKRMDDAFRRIAEKWPHLTDDQRQALLAVADSIVIKP